MDLPARTALVVVDVQDGFDDPRWGCGDDPGCEENVESLVDAFERAGQPVVLVQHDSEDPDSPLHPDSPGHALKAFLRDREPALLVRKSVNSSFHGTPDLHAWLRQEDVGALVVCGITTNHCCETTARVGGNLGHDVRFAIDATRTFDRQGPDGTVMTAAELVRATATNLHGEFATVVTTAEVLDALG